MLRLCDRWPDAVILFDASGGIAHANSAAESLFRFSAEQLKSIKARDLLPEELRNGAGMQIPDPITLAAANDTALELERGDGTRFRARVTLQPVEADGNPMTWAIVQQSASSSTAPNISEHERRSLNGIEQIAASAVDFQSLKREFGLLIRSLVPNSSTLITTLRPDRETMRITYIDFSGDQPAGSAQLDSNWRVDGTTCQEVMVTGKPVVRNFLDHAEFRKAYPGSGVAIENRELRSVMNIPLVANRQIFGFLVFRNAGKLDYTRTDLRRGQAIADLIGGSVAEMELRRRLAVEAEQSDTLRAIGQLLSSTLYLPDVFEPFADLVTRLIDFNVVAVSRLEHAAQTITLDHMLLKDTHPVGAREPASSYPAAGTMMEVHRDDTEPVLITLGDGDDLTDVYPGSAPAGVKNHLLTTILVPLLRTPSFNAFLLFQSERADAYSPDDLEIAGRIGTAVRGPVASAYMHTRELELAHQRELNLLSEYEKKRLTEINEAKSQFLGLLSHELKTPLTSITAFADLLNINRKGNLDDREMRQVEAIQRNSRQLESLITDLLDLSRIEAGKVTLELEPLDPRQLIAECVSEMENALSTKSQAMTFDSGDDEMVVPVDPQRLRQVLINLIGNASKYSPEETVIGITCRADAERLYVTLRDQGPGISEEDAENVFELFSRGHSTEAQQQQPGTGIGLYVARKVVEAHGGAISLKTHPDGGAVAEFSIPLKPVAQNDEAYPEAEAAVEAESDADTESDSQAA